MLIGNVYFLKYSLKIFLSFYFVTCSQRKGNKKRIENKTSHTYKTKFKARLLLFTS